MANCNRTSEFESSIKLDGTSKNLISNKETSFSNVKISDGCSKSKVKFLGKNRRRKYLLYSIFIVIFLLIILICLASLILRETSKKINISENTDESSKCTTNSCYKSSHFIMDNLNQTIDPCTNFYEFACGNWETDGNHFQEKEKDQFTLAYERMLLFFSDILETPINSNVIRILLTILF